MSAEMPPSPKFHAQVAGFPVDRSVNATVSGALPFIGVAENTGSGTGVGVGVGVEVGVGAGAVTLMKFVRVLVALPPVLATVRLTV